MEIWLYDVYIRTQDLRRNKAKYGPLNSPLYCQKRAFDNKGIGFLKLRASAISFITKLWNTGSVLY